MKSVVPNTPRCAVFVNGSSWSGASAIVDWIRNSHCFVKFPGQEIKAIGRGILALLEKLEKESVIGQRIAKRAFMPNSSIWPSVGLDGLRSRVDAVDRVHELVYLLLKRTALQTPAGQSFGEKLDDVMRRPYLNDEVYMQIVRELAKTLRSYSEYKTKDAVLDIVSDLVSYIHDKWTDYGIPVFDNAFVRDTVRYTKLATSKIDKRAYLFVVRDPRDQYAEVLNARFIPLMRRSAFRKSYKRFYRDVRRLCHERLNSNEICRVIPFERFVLNVDGFRSRLADELSVFFGGDLRLEPPAGPYFEASRSAKNIRRPASRLSRRQRNYLETHLPFFLFEESLGECWRSL